MKQESLPLWRKVLISVLIIEILGGLSGFLTASSIKDWYATLNQPVGNPPNWVFGPVWTTLYAMIGIAFALVWHRGRSTARKRALIIFGIQFALNLLWTPVFFGAHRIGAALAVIIALLLAIVWTIRHFYPINRTASLLLVPYLLWVSYATYLNASYFFLNR